MFDEQFDAEWPLVGAESGIEQGVGRLLAQDGALVGPQVRPDRRLVDKSALNMRPPIEHSEAVARRQVALEFRRGRQFLTGRRPERVSRDHGAG